MENIPLPILKVDKVENDGCPFAGYEKKHREAKKKLARKMKAGNCEICDAKFEDEDAHVKTTQHQNALNKKRPHFHKECFKIFKGIRVVGKGSWKEREVGKF